MHAEQHFLHHYHGHALRKQIKQKEDRIKALHDEATAHKAAGRHVAGTRAANRALRLNAQRIRHQKDLADIEHRVDGLAEMKNKLVEGSGSVKDSTDDSHKHYADKVGERFRPKREIKIVRPKVDEQSKKGARRKSKKPTPDPVLDLAETLDHVNVRKEGRSYRLSFPYNKDAVDLIRDFHHRKWDSDAKEWRVATQWKDDLPGLLTAIDGAIGGREKALAQRDKERAEKVAAITDANRRVKDGDYGPFNVYRAGEFYKVHFQYSEDRVAQIKALAESGPHDKKFDPLMKRWSVPVHKDAELADILERAQVTNKAEIESERERLREEKQRALAAEEAKRQQKEEEDKRVGRVYFNAQGRSKLEAMQVGELIEKEGRAYKIDAVKPRYYAEDGLSFGLSDDSGWLFHYSATPAPEDEGAPFLAKKQAEREALGRLVSARNTMSALENHMHDAGHYPQGMSRPEGDTYLDTSNIYGGGSWWVIGPKKIWFVRNNGADGDAWDRNNIGTGGAGAIGRYVPYNEKMAHTIREQEKVIRSNGHYTPEPHFKREAAPARGSSNMTFEEYCEDILDRHIGLMGEDERAEAYASYKAWMAPKKKAVVERHPDSKLKLSELEAKVERLLASQKIAIERAKNANAAVAKEFVRQAEAALAGKHTKADLLSLITLSSQASRQLNDQSLRDEKK
jgi:hypothetical protein